MRPFWFCFNKYPHRGWPQPCAPQLRSPGHNSGELRDTGEREGWDTKNVARRIESDLARIIGLAGTRLPAR